MSAKKKKFKPVITQVKLNPEQAVLSCECYDSGFMSFGFFSGFQGSFSDCDAYTKFFSFGNNWSSGSSRS